MKLIDCFLSGFKWYRRWRGGIWFYVCVPPVPEVGPLWTTNLISTERLIKVEDYSTIRPSI